jgi:hypothetical protein
MARMTVDDCLEKNPKSLSTDLGRSFSCASISEWFRAFGNNLRPKR